MKRTAITIVTFAAAMCTQRSGPLRFYTGAPSSRCRGELSGNQFSSDVREQPTAHSWYDGGESIAVPCGDPVLSQENDP